MRAFSFLILSVLTFNVHGEPPLSQTQAAPKSVYSFKVFSIDGQEVPLKDFAGKVLLIVNTASECGYTGQYKDLQKIYATYHKRGLEILAFPANDFGGQEPGSNQDIKNFCQKNYGVTFPLMAKSTVKGPGKSEIFQFLTSASAKHESGEIKWNFEKFLINKVGVLVSRFRSATNPSDKEFISELETLLR